MVLSYSSGRTPDAPTREGTDLALWCSRDLHWQAVVRFWNGSDPLTARDVSDVDVGPPVLLLGGVGVAEPVEDKVTQGR